jgi:hypothetical protein
MRAFWRSSLNAFPLKGGDFRCRRAAFHPGNFDVASCVGVAVMQCRASLHLHCLSYAKRTQPLRAACGHAPANRARARHVESGVAHKPTRHRFSIPGWGSAAFGRSQRRPAAPHWRSSNSKSNSVGAPSGCRCSVPAARVGGTAAELGRRRDFLLRPRVGLPPRRGNRRFEAEPADDFLDLGVDPL